MFCGRCGSVLADGARFCSACGAPVAVAEGAGSGYASGYAPPQGANWSAQYGPATGQYAPPIGDPLTRLQRPRAQRMVAGVCAGLAQHYHWELTWVRVLTVLIALFSSGAGVVAYVVFWLVMPEEPWALPASTTTVVPPPAGS
ncbi:PspC domain-containing protein [Acidipila sp. EB88]|uniref:PspC domain-containing protein n=1 Tax=Acidipila sp. EB88 TaxID=2305226 RepID=UPI000F5E27E8|nr:PspC domain-containing protein [Acidipila sp. EB88]RRA49513.1 PspC domain-containing protein [Acidipila sp. EB88]